MGKRMVLVLMAALGSALVPSTARMAGHGAGEVNQSKEVHRLACEGTFMGYPAGVVGRRAFVPTHAFGDGTVTFRGLLRVYAWQAQMIYEDHTTLAPYDGFLQASDGLWSIAVLDNMGGKMIIYDGRPTLGAPDIWGELICVWQKLAASW